MDTWPTDGRTFTTKYLGKRKEKSKKEGFLNPVYPSAETGKVTAATLIGHDGRFEWTYITPGDEGQINEVAYANSHSLYRAKEIYLTSSKQSVPYDSPFYCVSAKDNSYETC